MYSYQSHFLFNTVYLQLYIMIIDYTYPFHHETSFCDKKRFVDNYTQYRAQLHIIILVPLTLQTGINHMKTITNSITPINFTYGTVVFNIAIVFRLI